MEKKIKNILKGYTADLDALLATYSIEYIISTVKHGGTVINNECTQELNEVI